jgi:Planctomycete cytochrome C
MNKLSAIFGHAHPLLLHLPVGVLLLATLLAVLDRWYYRDERLTPTIRLALSVGAVSAVVAAFSGWLLAGKGDYDPDMLDQHRWTGVATAVLATLVWWGWQANLLGTVALVGLSALLGVAGHFGGNLTHGTDFLWADAPSTEQVALTPETPAYAGVIEPILVRNCLSCHKKGKTKGRLNMESPEELMKGGKHGPVLVAGKADKSELFRRVTLPLNDKAHMPPSGKVPLNEQEIAWLKWWINQGADFKKSLKELGGGL